MYCSCKGCILTVDEDSLPSLLPFQRCAKQHHWSQRAGVFGTVIKWMIVQHVQGNSAQYGNSVMTRLINECLWELVFVFVSDQEEEEFDFSCVWGSYQSLDDAE